MKQDAEPTILDVLVTMNAFSTHIDTELNTIKADLQHVKASMVTKDEFYRELDQIRGRLSQTITKDYLDDKLSDLRGEFFLHTNALKKRKV